jgi:hypothetical protein
VRPLSTNVPRPFIGRNDLTVTMMTAPPSELAARRAGKPNGYFNFGVLAPQASRST